MHCRLPLCVAAVAMVFLLAGVAPAAEDCPSNGTVRFGVEPYEAAARLTPVFQDVGTLLGQAPWLQGRSFCRHELHR
jgi:phosphonate transport system substrate-binding protein